MRVEKIKGRGTVWKFSGKAYVNGVVHAEAVFTAMIVSQSEKSEGK
jgi:3-hydroxymyristoyl/3-hydroxydecanoyl-(acyl carrier protein) dehydratase